MQEPVRTSLCPGCRLVLPERDVPAPDQFNASGECWQLFSDLSGYTIARRDPTFIHQHAVDAYEAQHAGGKTRNITVAFGLIGLYLALEKGFTGRQVQRAHRKIAKVRTAWPRLDPPAGPASITVQDVLQVPEGLERDALIRQWMAAVWESWAGQQPWVRETTDSAMGWR